MIRIRERSALATAARRRVLLGIERVAELVSRVSWRVLDWTDEAIYQIDRRR